MKPSEIIGSMPKWASATSDELVVSPAWAMPCRLGDRSCVMRLDAMRPADTIDVAITLEDEAHVLSLVDTPMFEDLHRLWSTRSDVPEPILLALIERECAPLLQLVENAARRQLKIVGLASDVPEDRLCARLCDANGMDMLSFAITATPSLVRMLGRINFIDASHPAVRETPVSSVTEIAAFVLSAADLASLAVGDALLLPEVGSVAPRLIIDGRFVVDGHGVDRFKDDGMLLVVDATTREIDLGTVLDHARAPSSPDAPQPSELRLLSSGRTLATGRLDSIAGQSAFIVESIG